MAPMFAAAPLTKVVLGASILLTLFSASNKVAEQIYLDDVSQLTGRQLWRLLTSFIPFEGLAEGLVGWTLLFRLGRTFERLMGRGKFAMFVLLSTLAALGARIGLMAGLPPVQAGQVVAGGGQPHSWLRTGLASGPYHIIFGLLPLYYAYVPAMTPAYFKVVGLKFSDKASTYGLAVALAACTGQRSLLAAAYSLAFGFLYSVPGPGKGLQAIGLPLAMRRAIGGILIPLLDDNVQPRPAPPSSPRGNGYADEGGFGHAAQAMGAGAGNGGARPAPAGDGHIGLGPVPEAAVVDRVVSMGFDRDAAILALRQAWGNEGRAVEILLGGGGG